ncbi:heme ABC exporter ATP-binding protein CcmA [Thermomicrobium sp. CFH 73360]|uniref:heme ABC exporter ATP-binding protein CcmA n=1 Tax=Thermomicrobium sp. CFH 73360 TaxID=2951987 RepID=UPI002076B6E3|nr:heme ABC exporter ATP-binding protein CcmA [Thermomicrobium sp. CFH 73360]MCM8745095.1 heme ABC exporter ATP-binding protein CcmA [Thermomicrobium sp. CFH 73360]
MNLTATPPNPDTLLPSEPVLVVQDLTKRYGWKSALAGVSFVVYPRECFVVFGPNGAGKTTLLRILAGLTRPSRGTISWFGYAFAAGASAIRAQLGVVMHRTMLDPELTVEENLDYYAKLYGVLNRRERIYRVAAELDLDDRLRDRVRQLSRGLQQRVALARALLHEPPVLLLDEPDTGLDRASRERLIGLITGHCAQGGTVLMTTHAQELGTRLATRAIFLDRGRIAWSASSSEEIERRLQPTTYGQVLG